MTNSRDYYLKFIIYRIKGWVFDRHICGEFDSFIFLETGAKDVFYFSGHVLGAAMFQVRVGSDSLVYTGDYNMTPDRHLGAAWIGKAICYFKISPQEGDHIWGI